MIEKWWQSVIVYILFGQHRSSFFDTCKSQTCDNQLVWSVTSDDEEKQHDVQLSTDHYNRFNDQLY